MAKVRLSVSVDDLHAATLGKVAAAAGKAGMDVEQQLGDLGVLTGSIDASKVSLLRGIAGVESVEVERHVGIAPPHSPIQ